MYPFTYPSPCMPGSLSSHSREDLIDSCDLPGILQPSMGTSSLGLDHSWQECSGLSLPGWALAKLLDGIVTYSCFLTLVVLSRACVGGRGWSEGIESPSIEGQSGIEANGSNPQGTQSQVPTYTLHSSFTPRPPWGLGTSLADVPLRSKSIIVRGKDVKIPLSVLLKFGENACLRIDEMWCFLICKIGIWEVIH